MVDLQRVRSSRAIRKLIYFSSVGTSMSHPVHIVLFNDAAVPISKLFYALKRNVPATQTVGLHLMILCFVFQSRALTNR